jgi:hypothetical protein
MNLVNKVIGDPKWMGLVTVGGVALSHFVIGLDLVFTGGIGVVGLYLTYKAHKGS